MTGTTREKAEGKPRPGGRALREGPEPTHLQQGEEVLVFILELIPLLDQWRHQLLNVFLETEWESELPRGVRQPNSVLSLKR